MDQRHKLPIHGILGLKFHSVEKANTIADSLENIPHDLYDENHERQL
jgi:hypothetical protein